LKLLSRFISFTIDATVKIAFLISALGIG